MPLPYSHPMISQSRASISKPTQCLNHHITTKLLMPKSHLQALQDPNWTITVRDEFNDLIANSTWVLFMRPPTENIVCSMQLYRKKYKAYISLERYKARLVANGKHQQFVINCDDTFSHVVELAYIHIVLSQLVSYN